MKKIKVGLLGLGYWGCNIARNLDEMGVLHKVFDIKKPVVENSNYIEKYFCDDPDKIFLDNEIDAIVIATPAKTHTDFAIRAINNKKHVFIEKPFCLSLNDAKKIISLAKMNETLIFVGHLLNYHNAFSELKSNISNGLIGNIKIIKSSRNHFGVIRKTESVLYDLGPHDISMVLSLTKSLPIEIEVNCFFINSKEFADIINVNLIFENNVRSVINLDWISPYKEHRFSVLGSKGSLIFDDTKGWEEKLSYNPSLINQNLEILFKKSNYIKINREEPLKKELQSFIDCIKYNKQPITNFQEALNVQKVLTMIDQELSKKIKL